MFRYTEYGPYICIGVVLAILFVLWAFWGGQNYEFVGLGPLSPDTCGSYTGSVYNWGNITPATGYDPINGNNCIPSDGVCIQTSPELIQNQNNIIIDNTPTISSTFTATGQQNSNEIVGSQHICHQDYDTINSHIASHTVIDKPTHDLNIEYDKSIDNEILSTQQKNIHENFEEFSQETHNTNFHEKNNTTLVENIEPVSLQNTQNVKNQKYIGPEQNLEKSISFPKILNNASQNPTINFSTKYTNPLKRNKGRFISKGERLCCQTMEKIYGVPFVSTWPSWLVNPETNKTLELDCYNDELKIAVEYNGEQHYKWPNFTNQNYQQFLNQVRRDALKFNLCDKNGVYLIVVPYNVPHDNIPSFIISHLPETIRNRLQEEKFISNATL